MIKIYYSPGTHGHFVEFFLNKSLLGDRISLHSPFTRLGNSHGWENDLQYREVRRQHFFSQHPDDENFDIEQEKHDPCIVIDIDSADDILNFQLQIHRNDGVDIELLESNTFHKLSNTSRCNKKHNMMLMIDCINQYYDLQPYYNIKDPSWPNIQSAEEFWSLPKHIIDECETVFQFRPVFIDAQHPDAPRWVLRSIFKSWFYNVNDRPAACMEHFKTRVSDYFLLSQTDLYDPDRFKQAVEKIQQHFNLEFVCYPEYLHEEFLKRVPFRGSRGNIENIFSAVKNNQNLTVHLNVIEEAYLDYLIETTYQANLNSYRDGYFANTLDIRARLADQGISLG